MAIINLFYKNPFIVLSTIYITTMIMGIVYIIPSNPNDYTIGILTSTFIISSFLQIYSLLVNDFIDIWRYFQGVILAIISSSFNFICYLNYQEHNLVSLYLIMPICILVSIVFQLVLLIYCFIRRYKEHNINSYDPI